VTEKVLRQATVPLLVTRSVSAPAKKEPVRAAKSKK
jgi:hypothetical protein